VLAPNTKLECLLGDKCRKVLAVAAFMMALTFVGVAPIALFALDALASDLTRSAHHATSAVAVIGAPSGPSADNSYAWLISIATPIAVIASAWGAVRSIQASHAETLKEIKLENEATNHKVDAVAEKVEKLGKDLAYIQGKFDSHSDD